jgi:hypothetical protein
MKFRQNLFSVNDYLAENQKQLVCFSNCGNLSLDFSFNRRSILQGLHNLW